MKKDSVGQFVALRDQLLKEKSTLETRLRQINEALANGMARAGDGFRAKSDRPAYRAHNPVSLREAVIQATSKKALSKQEILVEVQKMGYTFTGKNPMNSLNVLLYGKKPKFKNDQGRFSLEK